MNRRHLTVALIATLLVLTVAFAIGNLWQNDTPVATQHPNDTYPYRGRTTADGISPLKYNYGNSTDFMAHILRQRGIPKESYILLGNAQDWPTKAEGRPGVTLSDQPSIGAIGVATELFPGQLYHVLAMHDDGTLTVETYNEGYPDHQYSQMRKSPAELRITAYLEFKPE